MPWSAARAQGELDSERPCGRRRPIGITQWAAAIHTPPQRFEFGFRLWPIDNLDPVRRARQRPLAHPNFPSPAHRAAFYAQSLSLVEYLTANQSPKEFIRFVKLSLDRGHDEALQNIYGLNTHALERDWRERTLSGT